ncbi:MAG: acetyl/propionyl/methylcrotonyl-CoA carboxylase subunit alpha [Pseudomonadota bacterium]
MFQKILIANRGEIACRVAATARRLGVKTVAVYSEADANSKHVAVCDQAILLGAAPAADSYLHIEKIIAAALSSGAQAVHPGYGFLSENPAFADACSQAGLVFIGPPAAAMRAMGLKSAAKALMEAASVPLLPGYHGARQDAQFLLAEAETIGYPVLLKPSAGGGGKGMRVVESAAGFAAALTSCKREATSAFGNDHVLIEKYLQPARHIEIQIFADTLGNCVHLFERDCSVQRRHQKVLEESPAPGLSPERRAAMGAAAIAAAQSVGYVGAGTVEFIVAADGSFYFMEMNTRLQVEHPVTEMVLGLDLVEWQLLVACGGALPLPQAALSQRGHAIEARIYAENPAKGFLPSIGTLQYLAMPDALSFALKSDAAQTAAVRVDSGVRQGDTISAFYDPMIAKLIVWGADRAQALAGMAQALEGVQIVGVETNTAFLQRLIASPAFTNAELDTGLIERHQATLLAVPQPATVATLALACIALLQSEAAAGSSAPADPWDCRSGWRLNSVLQRRLRWSDAVATYTVLLSYRRDDYLLDIDGKQFSLGLQPSDSKDDSLNLQLLLDASIVKGTVIRHDARFHVFNAGLHTPLQYLDPLAHAATAEVQDGRLTAPMSGKVVALLVKPGQAVKKGAPLVTIEAMKMEHTVTAPHDGVVEQLLYACGDQVSDGAALLRLAAHA